MKPSQSPTLEEIHVAYQQGESAVLALFESQAKRIWELEVRLQALEDQLPKTVETATNRHPVMD